MKLVLLHSPLVGSGTWKAVAVLLQARGHTVVVPDLASVLRRDPPYYPHLAEAVALAAGPSHDTVLVVHSGAGALVPAIAARVCLRGAVFADAVLPYPGRSWFETVPEALKARLRKLVQDRKLPTWDRWWPEDAIRALLPDPALYEQFTAELPELPLAYLEECAPALPLTTPSAYLQLSDGYKMDADKAEAHSWPVMRLALHHLAMLNHPDTVASAVENLAATRSVPSPQ